MKTIKKFGRLREKIQQLFGTQKAFAEEMGWNVATLNLKLNGKVDWSRTDILRVCNVLDIAMDEVKEYFFYN